MTNTIYLITGASRGIGRGLTETFLARSNSTVIAAVRDPVVASSQSLQSLPKGESSRLIVVKVDSKFPTDPTAAIETLHSEHGIDHIDVVIANAGISEDFSTVHEVSIPVLHDHVEVNGYGPIYLYQAVYPLLKKSKKPTFVGVGSPIGSVGGMEQRPYPCAAYGPSKAILHWIVRKIHFENEEFVSFVADPG
jgi:norsolorinic acid ketoreductase